MKVRWLICKIFEIAQYEGMTFVSINLLLTILQWLLI
jgi:hypothetical protein